MKQILCILFIFFQFLIQCSPEKKDIMGKEHKLAQNAYINKELLNQYKLLENKLTDFDRARIYTEISNLQSQKGDVPAALKSAQEAIKYQPNQYMSYYLLGKSLIEAGRYEEAVLQLERSISLNNSYAPAHFEMANACYKQFKYEQALKEYKITTDLDTGHYEAFNNMGVLNILLNKAAVAEKNFLQAQKIKPDFARVYRNLGLLYDLKLKKPELAVINYEKYLQYMPNSPQRKAVHYWISVLKGK